MASEVSNPKPGFLNAAVHFPTVTDRLFFSIQFLSFLCSSPQVSENKGNIQANYVWQAMSGNLNKTTRNISYCNTNIGLNLFLLLQKFCLNKTLSNEIEMIN